MGEKSTPTGAPQDGTSKPIYQKWWFWLVLLFVIVTLNVFDGCTGDTDVADEEPAVSQPAEITPEPEPDDADVAQPADTTPVPGYTIARVDDVSMGTAVRFEYRVVVPGEPSEADLRAVIDDVIAEAKAGEPFNALSVGLYSSEDEIDGAYTLGVAEFAPAGDWSAADTVEAGDYDAMELVVTIY